MVLVGYVMLYLWAGNKNNVKFWVDFAIVIIIIVTIIIIMVCENTSG